MKDIEYSKVGDYYFPNIKAPSEEVHQLGKYARIKLAYLKEHNKAMYYQLLMEGKLNVYLHAIDEEANNMYELLLVQYKESWSITEKLKQKNQMKWVQQMNNIDKCIEIEIKNSIRYT